MQDLEAAELEHGSADLEAANCTELHHQIMSAAVRRAKGHRRARAAGEGPVRGQSARKVGASSVPHGGGVMLGADAPYPLHTVLSFPMSGARAPPASSHVESGSVATDAAALLIQLDHSGSHISTPEHTSWHPAPPVEEEERRMGEGSRRTGGDTASKLTASSLPQLQLPFPPLGENAEAEDVGQEGAAATDEVDVIMLGPHAPSSLAFGHGRKVSIRTATTTATNSLSTEGTNSMTATGSWHPSGFPQQQRSGQRVAGSPSTASPSIAATHSLLGDKGHSIGTISLFAASGSPQVLADSPGGVRTEGGAAASAVHGAASGRISPRLNPLDAATSEPAPLLTPTPHQGWLISPRGRGGGVAIDFNTSTLADSPDGTRQSQPAGAWIGAVHGISSVQEEAGQPAGPTVPSPVMTLIKFGIATVGPSVESHSLASSPKSGRGDFRHGRRSSLPGTRIKPGVPWIALMQPDAGPPHTTGGDAVEASFSQVSQGGSVGTAGE